MDLKIIFIQGVHQKTEYNREFSRSNKRPYEETIKVKIEKGLQKNPL